MRYDDARKIIRPGDLALYYRPRSLVARLQDRTGNSHAAMIDVLRGTAMILEFKEWIGSRAVTLKGQVYRNPAVINIYRPTCSPAAADVAATLWLRQMGRSYSLWALVLNGVAGFPVIKFAVDRFTRSRIDPQDTTPSPWDEGRVCSGVGWAYRVAALPEKWDPVPRLNDRLITPGILGRSASFELIASALTL